MVIPIGLLLHALQMVSTQVSKHFMERKVEWRSRFYEKLGFP